LRYQDDTSKTQIPIMCARFSPWPIGFIKKQKKRYETAVTVRENMNTSTLKSLILTIFLFFGCGPHQEAKIVHCHWGVQLPPNVIVDSALWVGTEGTIWYHCAPDSELFEPTIGDGFETLDSTWREWDTTWGTSWRSAINDSLRWRKWN
jgi:hypothetical protein